MTDERKEPHLSGIDDTGPRQDRIPTLSEVVSPDLFDLPLPDPGRAPQAPGGESAAEPHEWDPPTVRGREAELPEAEREIPAGDPHAEPALEPPGLEAAPVRDAAPEPAPAPIPEEEIEALADRVLDQIAPALREAVSAAVTELLDRHGRIRR